MTSLLTTLSLATLLSVGPTVIPIDETRFRVRITFDETTVSAHVNAQTALMKAAAKHCKGRGQAVSEGVLEVNKAEPLRKGKEALDLSEVYVCRAKAG